MGLEKAKRFVFSSTNQSARDSAFPEKNEKNISGIRSPASAGVDQSVKMKKQPEIPSGTGFLVVC